MESRLSCLLLVLVVFSSGCISSVPQSEADFKINKITSPTGAKILETRCPNRSISTTTSKLKNQQVVAWNVTLNTQNPYNGEADMTFQTYPGISISEPGRYDLVKESFQGGQFEYPPISYLKITPDYVHEEVDSTENKNISFRIKAVHNSIWDGQKSFSLPVTYQVIFSRNKERISTDCRGRVKMNFSGD